jgi:hypothetical protein
MFNKTRIENRVELIRNELVNQIGCVVLIEHHPHEKYKVLICEYRDYRPQIVLPFKNILKDELSTTITNCLKDFKNYQSSIDKYIEYRDKERMKFWQPNETIVEYQKRIGDNKMKNEWLESECTDVAREIKRYFSDYEISYIIKYREKLVNFFVHRRIGNQYCHTVTFSDLHNKDFLVHLIIRRITEENNKEKNLAESEYFYIDTDSVPSLYPNSLFIGGSADGKKLKELFNENYGWLQTNAVFEKTYASIEGKVDKKKDESKPEEPKSYNFSEAVRLMISGKKICYPSVRGYYHIKNGRIEHSDGGGLYHFRNLAMYTSNNWHEYTELAPCPICNTNENVILKTDNSGSYIHYECECCGCRKQSFKLSEEVQALTDWNKRDWNNTK